jgi:hypothetical protein
VLHTYFVHYAHDDAFFFVGNSVAQAISLLIRKGVPEDRIIFLNLISVYFFLCILNDSTVYYMFPFTACLVFTLDCFWSHPDLRPSLYYHLV